MSNIEIEALTVEQIYDLAFNVLSKFGCNKENANAIATTFATAERDGSLSHGLFRIPGYVASLKSGKVNGKAEPKITSSLPSVITVDGSLGYAPYSLEKSLPVLSDAALKHGIAVMRLINSFHFAALWPETEYLAERGLSGYCLYSLQAFCCTSWRNRTIFWNKPHFLCLAKKEFNPFSF